MNRRLVFAAVGMFLLSLALYATAWIVRSGWQLAAPGFLEAIANGLLLAGLALLIERAVSTRLLEAHEALVRKVEELGISFAAYRNDQAGGALPDPALIAHAKREVVILGYSLDNYLQTHLTQLSGLLLRGVRLGLLTLDPEHLEQADETEGRSLKGNIDGVKHVVEKLKSSGREMVQFYHYSGHMYFTGIFVDREILPTKGESPQRGRLGVVGFPRFRGQHDMLLVTE